MRKKNWIEFNNENVDDKSANQASTKIKSKKLLITKENKGKKGKTVTVISGFIYEEPLLLIELLRNLKMFCGTGGRLDDQSIHLQGDMKEKATKFLNKEGYEI